MSNTNNAHIESEIKALFSRFFDWEPVSAELIDTSRGKDDFGNTLIITMDNGERCVLKIVSNDFTFPGRIRIWQ